MTQNGALSTNQRRAMEALLSTPNVTAAAVKAGLGRRTLCRYLGDPVFKAELRSRQAEMLTATVSALAGLSGDAVEVLRGVMLDKTATHADRRQAAVSWLEHARRWTEVENLAERLELLEEVMNVSEN